MKEIWGKKTLGLEFDEKNVLLVFLLFWGNSWPGLWNFNLFWMPVSMLHGLSDVIVIKNSTW